MDRNITNMIITLLMITERLILRPWKYEDFLPAAEVHADSLQRKAKASYQRRGSSPPAPLIGQAKWCYWSRRITSPKY